MNDNFNEEKGNVRSLIEEIGSNKKLFFGIMFFCLLLLAFLIRVESQSELVRKIGVQPWYEKYDKTEKIDKEIFAACVFLFLFAWIGILDLIPRVMPLISKKEKQGPKEQYKNDSRSTPWVDNGMGYMTRYAWVLSRSIGMVAEEEGDTTNNPLRMKVFPDIDSAITYKEERGRSFENAYPHFATLNVKIEDFNENKIR